MAELRSFIFIDQLQPRTMCYLGTWIRGSLPRSRMAAQIIEVAPGLDIEPLTDVALKHAEVQGGILVVERQYGYLEIHSRSTAAVRAAAAAVLDELGTSADKAMKPQVLASKIVTRIDHQHAFLINRNKLGSMILQGESLFVLEMQPAAYARPEPVESAPAPTVEETNQEAERAAARRRSTVREKVSFVSSAPAEPAPSMSHSAAEPVAPPAPAPSEPAPAASDEAAPRKAGWWSRRFGSGE